MVTAFTLRSEKQDITEARNRAAGLASDHSQTLQRGIERALSATYAIAALVRQGHGQIPGFEAVATEMLPFYPGIAALALSPGGVISQVVPLAGNKKSLGFNQLKDPRQNKEAVLARDTGNAAVLVAAARAGHSMFDLGGDIRMGLERAGILVIDDTGVDTYSDERFYSYRRSVHRKEPDYGRHVHSIALERE